MIKTILTLIGPKRRNQLLALIPAMLLASLLEMAGLTMVVSICASFTDSAWLGENSAVLWLRGALHIRTDATLTEILLLVLIVLYAFKLPYLAWENYMMAKFARITRHEVSTRLCGRIIRSPYTFFIHHSTPELQNLLGQDMFQLSAGLEACMQILMEMLVALGMGICLFLIDPAMTLFLLMGILFLTLLIRVILIRPIGKASRQQRDANRRYWKWLHHIVEGIKDIKTGHHEAFYESRFTEASAEYLRSDYLRQFWIKLPSMCMESVMVLTVLLYLLFFVRSGKDLIYSLPSLSALAWTAVRLLPTFSRINSCLTRLSYAKTSVDAIRNAMEETAPKEIAPSVMRTEGNGNESIVLDHVSFSYGNGENTVLQDVEIEIPVGSSVGIVGPSGAGKTTLLDILLGLLTPDEGNALINGIPVAEYYDSMPDKVAYVPQTTFLIDDTVRNNVAMGIEQEQIRDEQVWEALEKAALAEKIRALPHGLDTQIGEQGIRLSGGERQRLGLARALYRNPSLIVFDEATSALDLETEAEIMNSISRLKGTRTLVIVSHRKSTISGCDRIYRVEDGKAVRER